jgi:hypothetical protein
MIHILVPRQADVQGLSQKVGEVRARILGTGVRQKLFDEFAQAQGFAELPDQNQTSVGSDPEPLKIHISQILERAMKGLILHVTHVGGPPERLRRIQTRINADEEERPKIHRGSSNSKSTLKRDRSQQADASSEFLERTASAYAIEPFDPVFAVFQHEHQQIFQDFDNPARDHN